MNSLYETSMDCVARYGADMLIMGKYYERDVGRNKKKFYWSIWFNIFVYK